ncbi:cytochrome P450 [Stachybotrys elegans]|uniref:Cytochrome P450 n=1 Tax=Stachybotrys elegans TaxID=80388 RepID=A0A8K0SJ21_9HYPO|nr:cytochrome P450 [Stachybotrys elegans]
MTFVRRSRFIRETGCRDAQTHMKLRDPIIGLDFLLDKLLGRVPETYLDAAHQDFLRLGQTYTAKRWTFEVLYTCNKDNIRQILGVGFNDWELPGLRVASMSSLLGRGIFTLNGHEWSHSRALLRPSFTKKNLEPLKDLLEHHFQAFLKRIPADGETVNLQPLFFELTMDVATEFLMGVSTNMLDGTRGHEREQQFVDDYQFCSEVCSRKLQMGPLHFCVISPSGIRAKNRVFRYVDDYVEKCLKQQVTDDSERYNVLYELAKSTEDPATLRDQVLHVLLASRDTAASLLSNLFFVLAKRPDIYAKLRSEVIEVAGTESVTNEQLHEMPYVKWCVQEALRLYPVVPTNARTASRDTTLPQGGGADGKSPLFVPKGGIIIYNMYSLHRDPAVYGGDPEDFRPERWDGLRPGWSYLPFSGGPRICIGQHYAVKELHYFVARMAQTFEVLESQDESEWTEQYALLMTCKNGVHVSLTRACRE